MTCCAKISQKPSNNDTQPSSGSKQRRAAPPRPRSPVTGPSLIVERQSGNHNQHRRPEPNRTAPAPIPTPSDHAFHVTECSPQMPPTNSPVIPLASNITLPILQPLRQARQERRAPALPAVFQARELGAAAEREAAVRRHGVIGFLSFCATVSAEFRGWLQAGSLGGWRRDYLPACRL